MLRTHHQFLTAMLHVPSFCCVWVCRNTCNEMIISKETKKVLKPIMATAWTAKRLKCYMMKSHFQLLQFVISPSAMLMVSYLNCWTSQCVWIYILTFWSGLIPMNIFDHNNPTDMEDVTLSSNFWNCLKNKVDTVILQFRPYFSHLKA